LENAGEKDGGSSVIAELPPSLIEQAIL